VEATAAKENEKYKLAVLVMALLVGQSLPLAVIAYILLPQRAQVLLSQMNQDQLNT
jgi:hypothetical protein